MGYELNKLMSLYGVSTPGMAPYGGAANDAAAMQQYNQYRTDYKNRVAATPMYGEQQYLTGLAGERVAPTYSSLITPPVNLKLTGPDNSLIVGPTIPGGTKDDTIIGGTKDDTLVGGGNTTYIGGGLGLTTSPADQGDATTYIGGGLGTDLLKQTRELQSGDNPKTRADLVEFYLTQFDRLPEKSGLDYWANKFGEDIDRTEMTELESAAQKELGQQADLKNLYSKYLQREPDRAGKEYWMGQISAAGGVTPEVERLFQQGAGQEVDMGNAGFRPGMYDVGQMGSRITPTESAQLYAAAPFVFGQDPTGAANNRARQQLYDLYTQNLGRTTPDQEGFNWWINKIGSDNIITPEEQNMFLAGANPMYHGGAVHDLAQKYKVGGAVRKFEIGGNKGELDESKITATRRAREMLDDEGFEAYLRNQEFIGNPASEMRAVASGPVTKTVPATDGVVESRDLSAQPVSPAAQPVKLPPAVTTPVSPAATDLMAMLANYGDDVYAPELKTARQKVSTENEKFAQMIETAMKSESAVPDKTELYFRLAKAFGSPTKTGALTENLSLVGGEAAEYAKDVRAGQRADKQLRTQLGLEAQKLRAQGAREDLSTLRTLAGEEMKDRRAILTEYIKSGRPQSEAGKAAIDAGLKQGTPEFTQFVEKYIDDKVRTGNLLKEAMVAIAAGQLQLGKKRVDIAEKTEKRAEEAAGKLTPGEVRLKADAETTLGGIDDAMSSLKRAYSLNPNTFDGTLIALAQRKILEQTDPKDPRVLATREQQNLLSKGAIDKLRASFGGNPTEGERAALLALEGIDSKSKEERAQIMKNTYKLLKDRREREQKRLNEISKGAYRETTPAPAAGDLE
jgi:hypothetical protein